MVIFWAYFFLPTLTGQRTDQFTTMLLALVLFDAVYLAEIVRAGIQGLDRGQFEAARSLGLGYLASMRLVVLPQALRNMLPSLVNQFVSTIRRPPWATSSAWPKSASSPRRSIPRCSPCRPRST